LTYYGLDVATIDGTDLDFVCSIDAPLIDSLRDREFDFILCTEVLEHVANWPAAFENLATILKTGGKLFITCPHVYQLHEEPFDYYRPTIHAIEYFARQNNLKSIYLEKGGRDWNVLGTVIANTEFRPAKGRFYDRQLARIAEYLRRRILKSLISNRLQRSVQASCSIYLFNVAILQKEAA
jgi:SAM-dependent methyltransferase